MVCVPNPTSVLPPPSPSLQDNVQLVRSMVGYVSVACSGIFRTSVEDNIAVATAREVTSAEVREVCCRVGAHEAFLQLPVRSGIGGGGEGL